MLPQSFSHQDPAMPPHLPFGDAGITGTSGSACMSGGTLKLTVNGAEVEVDERHTKTPLLWVLRDVLELRGTKFGCGAGHCAACTVLIDGRNTKACQTLADR